MSNGIYDILGKLAALAPNEEPKQEAPQKIYESVEAKGSILEGVAGIEKSLKEKYAELSESDVDAFLARGGKIQQLPPQKGPKHPGLSLASKHIGGGGDKMRASRTGRASNPQGKPVVGIGEDDDYWDFKDLKDEPKSKTIKVAGTRYGGSAQVDEPEDDDTGEVRGRGRPTGTGKKRAQWEFGYDEDFPSDFVSAYGELQRGEQGVAEAVMRGGDEDYPGDPDYEDRDNEDEGFFVAIGNEEDGMFLGMVTRDGGRWREVAISGNPPYNWGGANYMSYLSPQDVQQWINKDYGRYNQVEFFDSEEEARDYVSMMSEGNELNVGIEAYGVRGMNSKPWRKTFKSQAAFEKWLDANQDDVEVLGTREVNLNDMFGGSAADLTRGLTAFKEGEVTRKGNVTRHTKTEYPGYPTDEPEDEEPTKTAGRPRKTQTKKPRVDPNAPKKGRGRPAAEKPAFSGKNNGSALSAALGMGSAPKKHPPGRRHTMSESRMMDESGEALDHIVTRFGAEVRNFEQTGELDEDLYEALFDYYVATDRMPYIVQKAKRGADPYKWVAHQLEQDLGLNETQVTVEPVAAPVEPSTQLGTPDLERELNELARLAGLTIADEGNQFSGALAQAKASHQDTFNVDGKEYPVKEADVAVDGDNGEAEEDLANVPDEKYATIKSITTQGDDLNRQKKQDPHTANKAANPLTNDYMQLEAKLAAEYESIKKVSK